MFLIDGNCDNSKWSAFDFDHVLVEVRNYLDDWMMADDKVEYTEYADDILHAVVHTKDGEPTKYSCTIRHIKATEVLKR
jgi:hypothetical protein